MFFLPKVRLISQTTCLQSANHIFTACCLDLSVIFTENLNRKIQRKTVSSPYVTFFISAAAASCCWNAGCLLARTCQVDSDWKIYQNVFLARKFDGVSLSGFKVTGKFFSAVLTGKVCVFLTRNEVSLTGFFVVLN